MHVIVFIAVHIITILIRIKFDNSNAVAAFVIVSVGIVGIVRIIVMFAVAVIFPIAIVVIFVIIMFAIAVIFAIAIVVIFAIVAFFGKLACL
jgi:hypothetical protein